MKYRTFVNDPIVGTFWIIVDDLSRTWMTDPPGKQVREALIGLYFQPEDGGPGKDFDIFPDGRAYFWD